MPCYLKDFDGWHRLRSLDRQCAEQRMHRVWSQNLNCKGRRFAMCSVFEFNLRQGKSRKFAYKEAQLSQLHGLELNGLSANGINVDAKTVWTF